MIGWLLATLWQCRRAVNNETLIDDLPIKGGDCSVRYVSLPESSSPNEAGMIPVFAIQWLPGRDTRSICGTHIPYIFPVCWGAKELLRVS